MKRASTVVPICGNRILLVKRKPTARFMANRMVFPGGVEETGDAHWTSVGASAAQVCALRELFEEAGILMCTSTDGRTSLKKMDDEEMKVARAASTADAGEFVRLMERLNMKPHVARLKEWSRWITPVQEKHRYDTSFFVLRVSDEQAISTAADLNEVTEHNWLTAREALEAHQAKQIDLAPPTWLTLMELRDLDNGAIFSSVRKLTPIQPEIVPGDGLDTLFAVCLPGDHQHPSGKGTSALRRIVAEKEKGGYRWIDTIGGSTVAHSNF